MSSPIYRMKYPKGRGAWDICSKPKTSFVAKHEYFTGIGYSVLSPQLESPVKQERFGPKRMSSAPIMRVVRVYTWIPARRLNRIEQILHAPVPIHHEPEFGCTVYAIRLLTFLSKSREKPRRGSKKKIQVSRTSLSEKKTAVSFFGAEN